MKTRRTDESVVCVFDARSSLWVAFAVTAVGGLLAGGGLALAGSTTAGGIVALLGGLSAGWAWHLQRPVEVVFGLRGVRIRDTFASYRGLRIQVRQGRLEMRGPDVSYRSAVLDGADLLRPVLSWLTDTLEAGMLDRRHLDGLESGLARRATEHIGRRAGTSYEWGAHGAEVFLETQNPRALRWILWLGPIGVEVLLMGSAVLKLASGAPATLAVLWAMVALPFAALGVWAMVGHPTQIRVAIEGERVTFFDADVTGAQWSRPRSEIKRARLVGDRLVVEARDGRRLRTVALADTSRLKPLLDWLRGGEIRDGTRAASIGRATIERLVRQA
jgi:hypothetical protein